MPGSRDSIHPLNFSPLSSLFALFSSLFFLRSSLFSLLSFPSRGQCERRCWPDRCLLGLSSNLPRGLQEEVPVRFPAPAPGHVPADWGRPGLPGADRARTKAIRPAHARPRRRGPVGRGQTLCGSLLYLAHTLPTSSIWPRTGALGLEPRHAHQQ